MNGERNLLADFYLITIRAVLANPLLEIRTSMVPRGRCPRWMFAEDCNSCVSSKCPIMSNICTCVVAGASSVMASALLASLKFNALFVTSLMSVVFWLEEDVALLLELFLSFLVLDELDLSLRELEEFAAISVLLLDLTLLLDFADELERLSLLWLTADDVMLLEDSVLFVTMTFALAESVVELPSTFNPNMYSLVELSPFILPKNVIVWASES